MGEGSPSPEKRGGLRSCPFYRDGSWLGKSSLLMGPADPALGHDLPHRTHDSQSLGATLSGGASSGKRPWAVPRSSSSRSSKAGRGGGARGVRMARAKWPEVTPAGEGQDYVSGAA